MAGLLGDGWDSPQSQGLLALASGMIQGNFGKGVSDYGTTMASAQEREMRRKFEQMRMEQAQEEMLLAKQDREGKAYDSAAIRRSFSPIQGGDAMQNGQGPTLGNAANLGQMQPFDPRQFFAQNPQASVGALKQAMEMNQAFNPAKKLMNVPEGNVVLDEVTGKPVYTAPRAPKEVNPNQPFTLGPNGEFVPNVAYQDYERSKAKAGATNVNVPVNLGQKGFDNTLKLRTDFRGEPIYKAHQDVQSAYSQIQEGLKMQSPAGDLAGATKIMKLLDPGSVVRESELGMAMAATGALDRLMNYSDRVIKGTKLTPSQRQDFQKLADALYQESGKQYNTKRGEYQGIAERNGLSVPDVLGAEFKEVKPDKPSNRPQIPQKAINELKLRGPGYKAQFDAAFGAGSADSVLGEK